MRRASDHSSVKTNTPNTAPIEMQAMMTPKMMGCAAIAAFQPRAVSDRSDSLIGSP
jgi:hypothetical protein